jgi:hypothetical protein
LTPADDAAEVAAAEVKAKSAAKWVTYLGLALIGLIAPAWTSYQLAASEARDTAAKVAEKTAEVAAKTKTDGQQTKNEAEAGYQLTKEAVKDLQHRVLVLERTRSHRRVTLPATLPTDLKQAEKAVFAGTPSAVPAAPPVPAPIVVPYRDASPR